jgi:hypothetical protein
MIRRVLAIRLFLVGVVLALPPNMALSAELEEAARLLGFFNCAPRDLVDLPNVDLLIDDSISMRGFVQSDRGGRYRAVIERFERSGIGDNVTIRRLSSPGREPIKRSTTVLDPTLYSKDDTPLERAFDFARATPDSITVLISDLEHSTTNGDTRQARAALAAALVNKASVLLLGVRSAYSNQQMPRCSPTCPPQYRHFYVMIMARSPEILKLLVARSGIDSVAFDDDAAKIFGAPLYYSTRPAVEVTGVELLSDPVRGAWTEFRETAHIPCSDQALGHVQASFSYHGAWPSEPLRLLVNVIVHDPLSDLSEAVLQMSKIERPGWLSPRSVPTNGLQHSAHDRAFMTDKPIRFEYNLHETKRNTWDIYRIWFETKPANIEVPPWVARWNDQIPATRDASPAVAALVRTIIKEVTEKKPVLEHFIAIGRD